MKAAIPYIFVAVVAAFLGHARGYNAADTKWRAVEAAFRGGEFTTAPCEGAWRAAKKAPNYEALQDPYEGAHE